jgi:glycosyltransferase involved in cell wall biosynthesis
VILAPETREATPLLTVVVPALHVDAELRRCLDSIRLALPGAAECEIVLVVPARLVECARERFPDARVVAESRPSVYAAMNDGVAASTGRYLYFLGQDDVLLPVAAEALQVLVTERPYVLFADVYWGADGVRRGRTSRWRVLFMNVCQQGIVYSRDAVLANGPYLRRLRVQADHLLNIRVLWDPAALGRVRYLPRPLAWYAATGLSFRTRDTVFHRVHAAIIRRHLGPVAACLWRLYRRVRPEKVVP